VTDKAAVTGPAVVASGVSKSYRTRSGTLTPVCGFDLTLDRGQLVALHGPSGSGKTAIVHLLAGWEQPDRGSVTWPGAAGGSPTWSEVAVIPQTLALLDELTVGENIRLAERAGRRRNGGDESLAELLATLGLSHLVDRNVDQISIGEQQRVMIARALAPQPAVILADEPTAHQDDRNAAAIAALLAAAVVRGAACLIATRQTILRALADHPAVVHRQLSPPGTAG
jgi:putative ABC transport system ATP-binding protein